jgi:predicted PurR-regulated permease PerM
VALVLGLLGMFSLFSVSDLIGLGDLRRSIFLVVFSLLAGAFALWLGVSAVTRSRRASDGRPRGAVSAIVLGGISILFSALLLITFAVLWQELSTYSQCMQGANTLAAQHFCQDQLSRSVNTETSRLRSSR